MNKKKKDKERKIIYKNNDKYLGNWKDLIKESEGKIILWKGWYNEGTWKKDKIYISKMMRESNDENE